MALIRAYLPGSYSGSLNVGTPAIVPTDVSAQSTACMDIANAMPNIGASYAVQCDFVTLTDSGTVFFMDSGTQQLTLAAPVTTASASQDLSESDIAMIYGVETGFIVTGILVFGLIRQFKKISPLLF